MSEHTFMIPGELATLNEYTNQNRGNKYSGNKVKKDNTAKCIYHAMNALNRFKTKPNKNGLFDLEIQWTTKNNKKDSDNIFFGVKFILDGMVKAGMIANDNRKHIRNISHTIFTDKNVQSIIVKLIEVKER